MKNIKVPRELPLGLTQPAVECVKRWTFEPAILNRKPAEVLQIQMVRFDLSAQAPGESILIEPEEDALNRSGDDGALPQGEVDAPGLRVLRAMCAGLFF